MSAPKTILFVIAVLLASMLAAGLVSRFVFGEKNPDPVAIGVSALPFAAWILSLVYVASALQDTPRIPGRRLLRICLLSLASFLVVWLLGVAVPRLEVLTNHVTLVWVLVFALLVARERRRQMRPQQSAAPQESHTKASSPSEPKTPPP